MRTAEDDTEAKTWEVWSALVEHAELSWEAEVKNAERQSARVNVTLTLLIAFLGVGLFRFGTDPFMTAFPGWAASATRGFLLLGLAFLGCALIYLFGMVGRQRQTISLTGTGMEWLGRIFTQLRSRFFSGQSPESYQGPASTSLSDLWNHASLPETPEEGDPAEVLVLRWAYVVEAASELQRRNEDERRRIDRGQQWFVAGLACFFFSVCLYTMDARTQDLRRRSQVSARAEVNHEEQSEDPEDPEEREDSEEPEGAFAFGSGAPVPPK